MIDNSKEYIICAAIHYPELQTDTHHPANITTGMVVCGRRHYNVISVMDLLGVRTATAKHVQGFMTSKNRFLNRQEAAELAMQIGQIEGEIDDNEVASLVSKQLY